MTGNATNKVKVEAAKGVIDLSTEVPSTRMPHRSRCKDTVFTLHGGTLESYGALCSRGIGSDFTPLPE